VTIDPKTTALLMLDFMNQNCGQARPASPAFGDEKLLPRRAMRNDVVYSHIIALRRPQMSSRTWRR